MTTILRIDASSRTDRSLTRKMADSFIAHWQAHDPDSKVISRDVGQNPPAFVSEAWIAAAFSKNRTEAQKDLLKPSDTLIAEVEAADMIIISTPMYNYGMPAALKAWFDQVVRINKTFTFDLARGDRPLEPILSGRQVVALTSWGEFGFGPGELNDGGDNLVPHLRFASKYLGMEAFHHIGVEYQEFGDHRHEASKRAAWAKIEKLAGALAQAQRMLAA